MTIRERTEQNEVMLLSPAACLAIHSKGRKRQEAPCAIRTCFQRDVDRIVHSKAFRRLKHKTQVFLEPEGDHYRTRMTHTLEVTRIARTIARSLGLNEDLTEAAGLGHDLGHTPFGHAGEYALQDVYDPNFHHAAQSVRVVTLLEREGRGLNLTEEVREGILAHSDGQAWSRTQEGRVVRYLLSSLSYGAVECSASGLARQLGISRASVYRAFQDLEQAGLIRREGRAILVPDPAALEGVRGSG